VSNESNYLFIASGSVLNAGNTCPRCGKLMDGSKEISDEGLGAPLPPRPGDISLCMRCGTVSKFDKQLRSRLMTSAERCRLERDPYAKDLLERFERYRRSIQ
jgi:hypothetical protein